MRKTFKVFGGLAVVACASLPFAFGACSSDDSTPYNGEKYIYVNLGAEGGSNDLIVVVDADPASASYGKPIKSIDVGSKNNEPHHSGISADGKTAYFMGLFPPGKIWSLDLTADHAAPPLKTVVNDSSMLGANDPDEFVPMGDGRFLVSFMGSAGAGTPGAIGLFAANGSMQKLFLNDAADTSSVAFNPHGFDVRTDIKRMANGNFIMPADAANLDMTPVGDTFRKGLVVWEFDATAMTAHVIHTYDLAMGRDGKDGIMDVKMIPNDAKGRVFATNMRGGEIWLASTLEPFTATAVVTGLMTPQLLQITKDGKTMYATSYGDDKVHKYDITDPEHPMETGVVQGPEPMAGTPQGAHYCKLSSDEKRIYVTSYFVKLQDEVAAATMKTQLDTGAVDFSGTRTLWALTTSDMKKIDNFKVDFSGTSFTLKDGTAITGGPFGPHGVVLDK